MTPSRALVATIEEIRIAQDSNLSTIVSYRNLIEKLHKELAIHRLMDAGALSIFMRPTPNDSTEASMGYWHVICEANFEKNVADLATKEAKLKFSDNKMSLFGTQVKIRGSRQQALCRTVFIENIFAIDEIADNWSTEGILPSSLNNLENAQIRRKAYQIIRDTINSLNRTVRDKTKGKAKKILTVIDSTVCTDIVV